MKLNSGQTSIKQPAGHSSGCIQFLKSKIPLLTGMAMLMALASCHTGEVDYDASGNFEAAEVIVAAQQNGMLLSFSVNEGDRIKAGMVVGQIDVSLVQLQKEQTEASLSALKEKTSSPLPEIKLIEQQLAVQESQLQQQLRERTRTENLVKRDAATRKQLDDINAGIIQLQKQIAVTRQQINVSRTATTTRNRSVLSEEGPLQKVLAQYREQISRGRIVNPVDGVVLSKYALKGELAAVGKPLYKIADTDTLELRAYITGDQLPDIKLGQEVQVRIDQGEKDYQYYPGTLTWIADKSEFTPRTIQTKKERANLVYAIKVRVINDGYIKIGMYGEVFFKAKEGGVNRNAKK